MWGTHDEMTDGFDSVCCCCSQLGGAIVDWSSSTMISSILLIFQCSKYLDHSPEPSESAPSSSSFIIAKLSHERDLGSTIVEIGAGGGVASTVVGRMLFTWVFKVFIYLCHEPWRCRVWTVRRIDCDDTGANCTWCRNTGSAWSRHTVPEAAMVFHWLE